MRAAPGLVLAAKAKVDVPPVAAELRARSRGGFLTDWSCSRRAGKGGFFVVLEGVCERTSGAGYLLDETNGFLRDTDAHVVLA
jgi:hypothetical protein